MKHSRAATAACRDDPARRAPGRLSWRRDRDHHHVVTALDVFNMHTFEAEQ